MKLFILAIFLFATIRLQAQVADRPTISSAGGFSLLAGNLSFQSTIGETVIQTIQSGGMILTQGFQQPEQIVNMPVGNGGTPSDVIIYPNPAVDQVKIRFNLDAPAWVSFALINNAGQIMRLIPNTLFSVGPQEVPFDFHVPAGLYLLTLKFDGRTVTSKVIVE